MKFFLIVIISADAESVDFLQEISLDETSKKNITDKTFTTLNKKNLRVKKGLETCLYNAEMCEDNNFHQLPKNFLESNRPIFCQKSKIFI